MLIGYARVSTRDQRLTLHIDALERGQEELILRPDDYELVAQSSHIQFLNRTIQVGILLVPFIFGYFGFCAGHNQGEKRLGWLTNYFVDPEKSIYWQNKRATVKPRPQLSIGISPIHSVRIYLLKVSTFSYSKL